MSKAMQKAQTEARVDLQIGLSVPFQRPHQWRGDSGSVTLRGDAVAQVAQAVEGIQAITSLLMQREVDRENPPECGGLVLGSITVCGLLDAIASCAELVSLKVEEPATRPKSNGVHLNS